MYVFRFGSVVVLDVATVESFIKWDWENAKSVITFLFIEAHNNLKKTDFNNFSGQYFLVNYILCMFVVRGF